MNTEDTLKFLTGIRPQTTAIKQAIVCIVRQKAEIESLHKIFKSTMIEQYTNGRRNGIYDFAERLKKKACYPYVECDFQVVTTTDIDRLVKEMTEGLE